jgi:hypothetical protein
VSVVMTSHPNPGSGVPISERRSFSISSAETRCPVA